MSWRDHIKVHPAADLFPMMSEPELRELGEDIKKNGQKVQVILWADKAGETFLLDGRNRFAASEMVGLPFFDRSGNRAFNWRYMEGDPYDLVLSLNINRRHLTSAQKRELIDKVLKAKLDEREREIVVARFYRKPPILLGEIARGELNPKRKISYKENLNIAYRAVVRLPASLKSSDQSGGQNGYRTHRLYYRSNRGSR